MLKRARLASLLLIPIVATGCSAIPTELQNNADSLAAYDNEVDYLLSDFNNKEVTNRNVEVMPVYDMTGPVNSGVHTTDNSSSSSVGGSVGNSITGSLPGNVDSNGTLKWVQRAEFNVTEEEFRWLCAVTQAEAGGQGADGMMLVTNVIINRIKAKKYPDVITAIKAPKQFSTWTNGSVTANLNKPDFKSKQSLLESKDKKTKELALNVAMALKGHDNSKGATFFLADWDSDWKKGEGWFWNASHGIGQPKTLDFLFQHGAHLFFKETGAPDHYD